MNYQQTLEYLFSQLPMYQRVGKAAYKANLNNTIELDQHFNHPHRNYRTIHIAGSNGKGSVSHMIASSLFEAGYKVGLYTSPHLKDFRERIKVNGEMIPEENVVDFVQINKNIFERIKPSFFEMTVALAFDFFSKMNVDVAVIEVGLGGRLDSTNIITPELSVITNISLEHADLLGNSVEKIAWEKAGIIKPRVPVIISQTQDEIKHVFIQKANELKSPIAFTDKKYQHIKSDFVGDKQLLSIERKDDSSILKIELDLLGDYQSKNALGAIAALEHLSKNGFAINHKNIFYGLKNPVKNTQLLGRWQILDINPLIICDTGHNADGISHVANQLKKTKCNKLHMVIGMVGDKNIDGMLAILPKDATYYFTKASIPRAINEADLARKAAQFGLFGTTHESVSKAIMAEKTNALADDLIFIGGSTFVVAEAI